ncbi:MAG: TonB-dependent receptor [Proteobacteria bacterium]|nr:TonB-dependent receptor [Pseudomonadota bacterium]
MKKYLLSLMVLLPFTTISFAQEAEEAENSDVEEVVTTGIKSSLIDAIEIKRNKVGVTEIITAEDVGKFPDGNIAEALARISGIAIDRSNIEGKEVSVRGMGAQYNMVTLNGRTMPVAPTEYAGGRAFDFGAISSHGIARLEVYKTQNPALPSGGLGATINMVSARPLEAENGGALSALLMEDTTSVAGDKDLTPEIEFIHNYKSEFNGMEWGVSVSGSYHERQNREESTNEITWLPSTLDAPVYGPNLTDYFSDGSVNYRPTAFNIRYKDNDRIRKNLAATLQFGFDNVVATIDAVYSGVDFSTDGFEAGAPLNIPYSTPYGAGIGLDNVVIDKNGVVTQLEIVGSGTNLTQAVTFGQEDTSNQSLGFNLTWDVNDQLTLSFDVHNSYAQFKGGNSNLQFANGSWSGWGGDVPASDLGNAYEQWAELTNLTYTGNDNIPVLIPTTSIGFQSFARTVRDLEGRDMSSTTGQLNNNDRNSKILQYQFNGSWQNLNGMLTDSLVSVDFGISSMKQKFTRVLRSNVLTAPIGYDYSPGSLIYGPAYWDDSVFTKTDASYLLSDTADAAAIPYYMHISYEDAVAGYNAGYWTSLNGFDCDEGVPNCFGDPQDGARVTETMDSLFIQANFEGDLNGKPWKLETSLRYEDLGLSTPQEYTVPTGTFIGTYAWTDGPYFIKGPDFRTVSGSYMSDSDIVLPSIAFSIAPTENTVVRFSAGTTIARAGLEKLTPNIVFPEFLSINKPYHVLTSGNPDLKPLKSQNLDLAFEYYYAEGSYAAINLFQKDLEDFVTNTFARVTFDGLYDVRYGLDGQPLDFGNPARAFPSMDWWVDARANHQNNVPGSTCTGAQRSWDDWFFYQDQECVTADPSINPLAQWDLARPENLNSGTIKGAEIAIQHFFTGTNFGAIFNYTFIGGDTEAGPDAVRDETFELAGFGDSGNLTVFYEDDKFSARLSNNFRAETYSGFDQYNPIWIEARHQLDASASYIINDKFTVFVEGLNLTDSEVRLYSRYENMLFLAQNHGPVFKAGFRMKF